MAKHVLVTGPQPQLSGSRHDQRAARGSGQRCPPQRWLVILSLLLIPALCAAQPAPDAEKVLTAAVPASFPPEYSLDNYGRPTGFAIEALTQIAKRAGLRITFRVFEGWPEVRRALQEGEADLIPMAGILPGRKAHMVFTRPMTKSTIRLFVRDRTDDIRGVDDLKSRTVAVVKTNAAIDVLAGSSDVTVHVFPTIDEAVLGLLTGEVDALAYPEPTLKRLARRSGLEPLLKTVGPPLLEVGRGIAVRKDRADLIPKLNAAVVEFARSPEYAALYAKWFGTPMAFWTIRRVVLGMGSAMVLVVLFGVTWWLLCMRQLNARLQDQIRDRDLAIAQRDAFQGEMMASESRYRTLVEGPMQAIVVHREGQPLFANQAYLDLFGYRNLEEALSMSEIADRYHPDYREAVLAHREKVERGEHPPRIEYRLRRPNGSTAWVTGNSTRVEWDGAVAHQITLVDITERRAATSVLENFFNTSNDGLVVADTQSGIVRCNGAFADALGRDASELIGQSLFELLEPEDRQRTLALTREVQEAENPAHVVNFENRYQRIDGTSIWFSWNAVLGEDGLAYCSARDVTLQKQAEAELRSERNRTRQIIEKSVDGIVVIDSGGNVAFANPSACELFGLANDALIGTSLGLPAVQDEAEISIPRGDGFRQVELRSTTIDWAGRQAKLALLRDVTRQREADRDRIRLAAAVEQSADSILITDPDGTITYVNPAFESTSGYTRAESIGQTPRITNSDAHEREFFTNLWQTIRSGDVWRDEITNRCKNGSEMIQDVTISPVFDEWGEIMNYIGVHHDVTKRKQAEDQLRESQQLLQGVFDALPMALLVINPDSREIITTNSAVEKVFGYSPTELLGRSSELLNVDRQHFEDVWGRAIPLLNSTGQWSSEFRMRRKDGSVFPSEHLVTLLRDEDGGWKAVIAVVADITDRKRSEAILVEREERFRAIIENSVDMTTLLDVDGKILLASPSVRDTIGYDPEEIVGRSVPEFLHEDDVPANAAAISEALAVPGTLCELQYRMRHKDGSWRHVESRGRSLPVALGDAIAVVNSRDITNQKNLEDQLRQMQKMEAIGSLAGGIAHDFNNLLSIILSYSELVLEKFHEDDPARDDVNHIVMAGQRAAGLTRQLLAFSRRQILKLEVLDLGAVVQGIEKMLHRLIGEDVELVVRIAGGPHWVNADAGQLEQVVMNLAVNARDAMPTGGQLDIGIKAVELDECYAEQHLEVEPGAYVMLTVADSGIGIDEETRNRIFEPFFTTKDPGKGTGLGLATVYGIVQQLGGSVGLYSEVGKGTVFRIYLPRHTSQGDTVEAPAADGPLPHGQETVLVVEDEEHVRTATCRMLRQYGYIVLEAGNAGEALQLCEQGGRQLDLLLTDVVMPKMSGRELADRLETIVPDIRTIFMSGYTDDAILRHGVAGDDVAFLHKPFSKQTLLEAVRQTLDASKTG